MSGRGEDPVQPWAGPILATALMLGLVLLAIQLWLLTVALDLLLGGGGGFVRLAVASAGVFAGGVLVAYSQRCPHLSCAVVYQDDRQRFFCPCHDGVFEVRSGVPIAGPPRRPLARITLEVEGGVVYATGIAS